MADKPVLYGRATSANVQKVMWIFHELDTDYERVDAGGPFGQLDTPAYIAMNPNQLVPTLVDGDLKLWESHAIIRYVAATYGGGRLWVADPARRAMVDQWTDWAGSTYQPGWLGVFMQAYLMKEDYRSADAIAAALTKAERLFGIMDRTLQKTPWLAGEDFSYADIVCGVAMHRWTTIDIDRKAHDGVQAWLGRLRERPAFNEIVCTSFAMMENTLGG